MKVDQEQEACFRIEEKFPMEYADRKIRELRKMITDRGLKTKIEVDGRISPDNIRTYGKGDVDIFVTGSTCIKKDNMEQSLADLMKLHDLVQGTSGK